MKRSKFAPRVVDGAAASALAFLRRRKAQLLTSVAAERLTAKDAERKLARAYSQLLREYLRTPGTTYGAWIDAGVLGELEELREARKDDAVWDRLVETYQHRRAEARATD